MFVKFLLFEMEKMKSEEMKFNNCSDSKKCEQMKISGIRDSKKLKLNVSEK